MSRRIPFYASTVRPPPFFVALFVLCYGVMWGCFWLIDESQARKTGVHIFTGADSEPVDSILGAILGLAAAMYAWFRIWRYHPACNSGYAAWLKLSPWTPDKPLPLGPVYPVLQDVVVIGVLTAVAYWHVRVDSLVPVAGFSVTYLIGMTFLMAFTKRWRHFVALALLWPSLLLTGTQVWAALAIVVVIVMVIWHGYRQGLKAFRPEIERTLDAALANASQAKVALGAANSAAAAGTTQNLGWPYLALSPKMRPRGVSAFANLATSAIMGWWCFCLVTVTQPGPAPEVILIFAIFAALMRLAAYGSGMTTPFNILGRISSGRFIVPGYDKIFVGPLAVVAVAVVGDIMVKLSYEWYPAAEAVTFGMVWLVLLGSGPTLRNWALTGQHFLKPTRNKQITMRPGQGLS